MMLINRIFDINLKKYLDRVFPAMKIFISIVLISGFAALYLFKSQAAMAAGTQLDDVKLHDFPVINQDGQTLMFKSEIVKDRIVVVIPFYTTCTTAYPILIFTFTRLQHMLAEQLGQKVVLISVSVEPKIDTPSKMKAFARRQKAMDGWMFISGKKDNLEKILYGIGVLPSENLVEHNHNPITIVGGAQTKWRRFHGFPSHELLKNEIDQIMGKK